MVYKPEVLSNLNIVCQLFSKETACGIGVNKLWQKHFHLYFLVDHVCIQNGSFKQVKSLVKLLII